MTITQTVDIPADRRVRFDFIVPRDIPEGQTNVVIQFPFPAKVQPSETTATEEKPKMHIPKNSNGKFRISRQELDELRKNSPISQSLSGILSGLGDVDLDEVRMARLARQL